MKRFMSDSGFVHNRITAFQHYILQLYCHIYKYKELLIAIFATISSSLDIIPL